MLNCAKFWARHLESGEDGKLQINDVVGSDEYKEHMDDNAFTSVLASDIGNPELGHEKFQKVCLIDLDIANPYCSTICNISV